MFIYFHSRSLGPRSRKPVIIATVEEFFIDSNENTHMHAQGLLGTWYITYNLELTVSETKKIAYT